MTRTRTLLGSALALSLLSACGPKPLPPPALVAAREAYDNAAQGTAAELAPAKLDTAKQALTQAEQAWADDPKAKRAETLTLAYIAERRALTSAAAGDTEKARREKTLIDEKYLELERKRASLTQEELARVKAKIAEKENELEHERSARAEAERRLSAAVKSLAELASVKEESRGVVITLSGQVLFKTGKYELLDIAKSQLTDVAKALQDGGFKKLLIEGHTDSVGKAHDNEALSLNRANAVKQHLVSQGLDGSKIDTKGLGPSRPVASNDTPEGRANNRRVEIVVSQ